MIDTRFRAYVASYTGEKFAKALSARDLEMLKNNRYYGDAKGIKWADEHPSKKLIGKIIDIIYKEEILPLLDNSSTNIDSVKEDLYDMAFEYDNGVRDKMISTVIKSFDAEEIEHDWENVIYQETPTAPSESVLYTSMKDKEDKKE